MFLVILLFLLALSHIQIYNSNFKVFSLLSSANVVDMNPAPIPTDALKSAKILPSKSKYIQNLKQQLLDAKKTEIFLKETDLNISLQP